jgi:hypothetical protein
MLAQEIQVQEKIDSIENANDLQKLLMLLTRI